MLISLGLAALQAASVATSPATAASTGSATSLTYTDNLGIQPGLIKHVWLIILENKSYDASFSGLNDNTYLWSTLPTQGALLKNYYATGHSSQDNYISLVSGQAPQPDDQDDCTYYNQGDNAATAGGAATNNGVDVSDPGLSWQATFSNNPNYGQWTSGTGANGYVTTDGCVYPTSVPTLFNQFDAAGITWKGYAQDLGDQNTGQSTVRGSGAPTNVPDSSTSALQLDEDACGAPYDNSGESIASPTYPVASVPASTVTNGSGTSDDANPGSANANGAYVPKHFPFPWFQSLLVNSNDCNPQHIGPMFDYPVSETAGQNVGDFYSDLQADSSDPDSYPNFVWITPNNCSDAHDAECVNNGAYKTPTAVCTDPTTSGGCSEGGNLSGGWDAPDIPAPPTNGTGGLWAADQFLSHVIPEIESSTEYKDGGLIDITFDEGYPPYTYSNSFYNDSSADNPAGSPYNANQSMQPGASAALATDANGETLDINGTDTKVTQGCLSSASTASPGEGGARETSNGLCIPTGPNAPIVVDSSTGEQMSPGPGDAAGLDKPDNCTAENSSNSVAISLYSVGSVGTCILGFQDSTPGNDNAGAKTRTDSTTESSGSFWVQDNAIKVTDEGRGVSGTGIPSGSEVGTVVEGPSGSCTPPSGSAAPTCDPSALTPSAIATGAGGSTGLQLNGWFELVNGNGNAQAATASGTESLTLSAFCDPTPANEGGPASACTSAAADPYYDTTQSQTPGGGLTGSLLISGYIKPGTVSTSYYNHYSWLRTMEDLFGVGSASPGLDGLGHIGYAAQPGLVPFGSDVFTNAPGAEGLLISELRFVGPGGTAGDDYVDLANQSGASIDLSGWELEYALSGGGTQTVALSGTVPNNGHYLVADSGYSLGSVAAPDQSVSLSGTPDGVELIDTNTDTTQDAVGFNGSPGDFSMGTPLSTPSSYPTGQFAWTRNFANGSLANTGNNAADFSYVSTTNIAQPAEGSPIAGDPGPANSLSPVVHNDVLQSSLIDPSVAANAYPNFSYNPSTGVVDINRELTNCSGQATTGVCINAKPGTVAGTVTDLRFRITGLSTAVMLAVNSPGGPATDANGNWTLSPLTLEAPASGTGGLNAVLSANADLPSGGLAAGASIEVQFQFQKQSDGAFAFAYNAEDDLRPDSSGTGSSASLGPAPSGTPITSVTTGTLTAHGATVTVTPETKTHAKKKAKRHHKRHAKKHQRKHKAIKHRGH